MSLKKAYFLGILGPPIAGSSCGGNERQSVLPFIWFLEKKIIFILCLGLPDRLMVGQRPLEAFILVRVQVRQP